MIIFPSGIYIKFEMNQISQKLKLKLIIKKVMEVFRNIKIRIICFREIN
jgi:hypothetical protein